MSTSPPTSDQPIGDARVRVLSETSARAVFLLCIFWSLFQVYVASSIPFWLSSLTGISLVFNNQETTTFGVGATVITSAKVPDDVVYIVVKAVFDNFADFKKLHPAFANLKEDQMISDGLSAPLHPGAVRYYKERGWM